MHRTLVTVAVVFLCALGGCRPPDGEDGPVTKNFGDPQVMGLAVVLTDHQVQVAMAAIARGLERTAVQDYATRMIADFAPARDRLLAIAADQGIAVDESTTEAKTHLEDTTEDIALLQPPTSTGVQVDQTYLADSVHDIDKTILIWDATLLPYVTNPGLRDELTAIRPALVDTLARGQAIARQNGILPKP